MKSPIALYGLGVLLVLAVSGCGVSSGTGDWTVPESTRAQTAEDQPSHLPALPEGSTVDESDFRFLGEDSRGSRFYVAQSQESGEICVFSDLVEPGEAGISCAESIPVGWVSGYAKVTYDPDFVGDEGGETVGQYLHVSYIY